LSIPAQTPAAALRSELAITHAAVRPLLPALGAHNINVLSGRESPTAIVAIAEAKAQPFLLTIAQSPPIPLDSWPKPVLKKVASMPVATGEVAVPPDSTPDLPPGEAIAVTAENTYIRLLVCL